MNPMLRRVNNFAEVPVTGDLEEIIEIREEKSGKAMVLYSDVTTAEKHFEDLQTLSSVDVELYTENLICIEAKPYEVYVENTDAEDLLEEYRHCRISSGYVRLEARQGLRSVVNCQRRRLQC